MGPLSYDSLLSYDGGPRPDAYTGAKISSTLGAFLTPAACSGTVSYLQRSAAKRAQAQGDA
jgi:hypothetical protein